MRNYIAYSPTPGVFGRVMVFVIIVAVVVGFIILYKKVLNPTNKLVHASKAKRSGENVAYSEEKWHGVHLYVKIVFGDGTWYRGHASDTSSAEVVPVFYGSKNAQKEGAVLQAAKKAHEEAVLRNEGKLK